MSLLKNSVGVHFVAAHEKARKSGPTNGGTLKRAALGRRASRFLREFGFAFSIRLAVDGQDLGVMSKAVDQRDGTRRIREDRAPFHEGSVRRQHNRFLLIAAAHDLKQEVGRMGVVREIPDLVNAEE